jgi:hypothetical protein
MFIRHRHDLSQNRKVVLCQEISSGITVTDICTSLLAAVISGVRCWIHPAAVISCFVF